MLATESPATVCRWRFTLDDYHRMVETGILDENDRVELIEGELIAMAAIGGRHFACVNSFTMSFAPRVVGRAIVSVQNPDTLPPRSEPQPDIVLIRIRPKEARAELPKPEDVLLIIEVADTTARLRPRHQAAPVCRRWHPRGLDHRPSAPTRLRPPTAGR